jgi:hypothetical protein
VKVEAVVFNNRKRLFEIVAEGTQYPFPYAKVDPPLMAGDRVVSVEIDPEIGCEGFIYRLASGAEGLVHVEQALDYNQEPGYMRDLLLHQLTVEAINRIKTARVPKRELIRRLGTSPAQFYRLIDPANYNKSVDGMLALLRILDCEIDVVVKDRTA